MILLLHKCFPAEYNSYHKISKQCRAQMVVHSAEGKYLYWLTLTRPVLV